MKICTPLQLRKQSEVITQLQHLKGKVDLAEIWLDHIEDLNMKELLKNKPLPVLCVCKKKLDKGKFKGTYAEEAELLIEACKNGADYVDIPLRMPEVLNKKIIREVRNQKSEIRSQLIFSYHNFNKALSLTQLRQKVKKMRERGADIVKIAMKGTRLQHSLDMIFLAKELQQKGIPHILITMGKRGIITRVITPLLGGAMMFAPLSHKNSTASGQLTAKELREYWAAFK